jgi:DNA repair protein REV1
MSSFTSVPGDDGFRNYMARKIELQRRQFGLVLPPPPTQHQQEQPIAQLSAVILKKSSTTKTLDDAHGNSYSLTRGINSTKKKSVRFYENLDVDGVSQVLKNLKRKHAGEVSSRFSSADTRQQKLLRRATSNSDRESPTDSILGVLDNLQKRYGKSCLKKRRSFTADKSSKKPENSQSGSTQTTSEITLVEYDDRAAHHSYLEHDNPCVSRFTPPPKRIVESTRCKGGSFLEELEPALHDNSSQEDGAIAYDCLGQHYPEEYSHDHSISLKVSLSQLSKHSPALSADHSPPIIRTEPPSIKSPRKPNPRPDLYFIGVVVLVNGHTSPDATTLMRLLHKHGGDLEKYETQRVTHIIAEQLSVAKANIYKHQKKPTPVCRPEWITRSVESGKLLPYGDYLLENVRDRDAVGTKSVKSFFRPNSLLAHKKMDENASSLEEGSNMRSSDKTKSRHRWQDKHSSEASYHIDGQVRTIGNDPNFLESYFSNSRLSYIGSFKQRVKATKQTACRSEPVAGARKFVLLVDMDCFFASVALRKYPQYTDKPVAVGHSHVGRSFPNENAAKTKSKNSSSELSTCNYIARKRGVRKGMFLGAWPYEADLLCFASNIYVIDYVLNETSAGDAIQLCPDLVVLPYDFDGYEEVTGVVADLLHGYAEQYNGCVEQVSCDESYLEININSNDNDLGNDIFAFANSIAENIRSDILGNTACTASIGVGPNKVRCGIFCTSFVFLVTNISP